MIKVRHIVIDTIIKMHASNCLVVSAILNFGSCLQVSKMLTVGQPQPKMYITNPGTSMTARLYTLH